MIITKPLSMSLILACATSTTMSCKTMNTPMPTNTRSELLPIRTVEGITEYQLKNGLRVLLFPDASQSTVTVNITYLVGSRHEGRGESGMAHLLEHMLFKGTPTHTNIKGVLQDRGAFFNATTWFDRTNYFETLPATADNLNFALKLEADRMIHSMIRKEDLDSEMTVVRNEFEMGENDPIHVLHDQMMSAAYRWHNYGKSTIGNKSDIERVPVPALRKFYENYYQPDNAVLIVAGKFDANKVLPEVDSIFGSIPRPTRKLDPTYTEEPAQDGAREVKLLRSGDVASTGAAYHIPAGSDKDYAAVYVLANVLADEPSGVLYKNLVETGLASDVFGMTYGLAEPGVLMAFARPTKIEDVLKVRDLMIKLLEKDLDKSITSENVDRVKARILKKIKLSLSNSKELSIRLSEAISQGDYRLYFWFRDRVKAVTLADVKRVAKQYLIESNRTAGVFIPTKDPVRATVPAAPAVEAMLQGYVGSNDTKSGDVFVASVENIEKHVQRKTLPNNIKAALLSKQTRGNLVKARLIFRYGDEKALTGHVEALELLPSVMMRGTKTMSFQQIQDRLDVLESQLDLSGIPGATVATITSDKEHLDDVLALLAEIMEKPALSATELDIVKKKRLADLEEARQDPQSLGFNQLSRLTNPWPKSSIHYVPTIAEEETRVKAVTASALKDLHARFYGANHLELSVVGTFDTKAVEWKIGKLFGHWHAKAPYTRVTKPFVNATAKDETLIAKDKQMALVALGTNVALRDDDPDYPAVRLASYVLGESMKSRLFTHLREEQGLSYSTRSMLDASRFEKNTNLSMFAISATQNAMKAQSSLHHEFTHWVANGLTQEELNESKKSFRSTLDNLLADDNYVGRALSTDLEIGRTLFFYDDLLKKIDGLSVDDVKRVLQKYFADAPVAQVKAGDFPS